MNRIPRLIPVLVAALAALAAVAAFASPGASAVSPAPSPGPDAAGEATSPWRAAGLSDRQAAAILLDRFAYGPRPGEVERVAATGPAAWLEEQLAAELPDPGLAARLAALTVPPDRRSAMRRRPVPGETPRQAMKRQARTEGRERLVLLFGGKVLRAAHAENQLREVLTDFWYDRLYVSLADPHHHRFGPAYEDEAIRPHALGSYPDLLRASARHPAMLVYLDNALSGAEPGRRTTLEVERERLGGARRRTPPPPDDRALAGRGLNENYARELLELHTLGVDGGYTEADVREAARALSGWSVMPLGPAAAAVESRLARAQRWGGLGFVREGDFLFRADLHDAEPKVFLGTHLPAGRGIEDGEAVVALLAAHPATARFVARELAVRFVADDPPAALVDRVARAYRATGGDVAEMLRSLVAEPDFWTAAAARTKVKSPFELAVSALRGLGAEVETPWAVVGMVDRMGERPYTVLAPTGYPETGDGRLEAGTLYERFRFAGMLAGGRMPGISFDPVTLLGSRAGSGPGGPLRAAIAALLPERGLTARDFAAAGAPPAKAAPAIGLVLASPEFQVH